MMSEIGCVGWIDLKAWFYGKITKVNNDAFSAIFVGYIGDGLHKEKSYAEDFDRNQVVTSVTMQYQPNSQFRKDNIKSINNMGGYTSSVRGIFRIATPNEM